MKKEKSEVHLSKFSNFEDKLTIIIKRKKKKKNSLIDSYISYPITLCVCCSLEKEKSEFWNLKRRIHVKNSGERERERGKRDGKRIGTRPLEASSPPPTVHPNGRQSIPCSIPRHQSRVKINLMGRGAHVCQ